MKSSHLPGATDAAPRFQMLAMTTAVMALLLFATSYVTAQTVANRSSQKEEHSTQKMGPIIFQDYFTDGNDNGWKQVNRRWHVTLGRYIQDGDYLPDALGRGGYSLTHVGDKSWRDYVMSATFDITNAPGLPSPDVHTANFFVRTQRFKQPGFDVGSPSGGTFYEISVWAKGVLDPRTGGANVLPEGLVIFAKFVNGVQVLRVDKEHSNSVVGTNSITIKAAGKRIQAWANGEEVVDFTDRNPIRFGGIGLSTTWEAEAWFDNVIVSLVDGARHDKDEHGSRDDH
ncbi:MAG: family 16 glycoside hydrolase [Candidatus Angelobacter sp.]